ncbi:LuxR C-terminal-related transcriptional regulator, partial [Klebsiella pneumoniae]
VLVGLAIDQIAQSGLSSLSVIYYSAQLFSCGGLEKDSRRCVKCPRLTLTKSQLYIIDAIRTGMNNQQIAQKLGISHKTIFSHKINIMKKFQIATKQELTRFSSVALALSAGRIG